MAQPTWLCLIIIKKGSKVMDGIILMFDGHNYNEIKKAIRKAHTAKSPTVISCRNKNRLWLPNKFESFFSWKSIRIRGNKLSEKKKLNWNHLPFEIPKKLLNQWKSFGFNGLKIEKNGIRFF